MYKASTTNMLGGVQLVLSAISGIARFWFKLCMHTLKTSHHWLRALNHKMPAFLKQRLLHTFSSIFRKKIQDLNNKLDEIVNCHIDKDGHELYSDYDEEVDEEM